MSKSSDRMQPPVKLNSEMDHQNEAHDALVNRSLAEARSRVDAMQGLAEEKPRRRCLARIYGPAAEYMPTLWCKQSRSECFSRTREGNL